MKEYAARDYAKFMSIDVSSASNPWKPDYTTDKNLGLSLNYML